MVIFMVTGDLLNMLWNLFGGETKKLKETISGQQNEMDELIRNLNALRIQHNEVTNLAETEAQKSAKLRNYIDKLGDTQTSTVGGQMLSPFFNTTDKFTGMFGLGDNGFNEMDLSDVYAPQTSAPFMQDWMQKGIQERYIWSQALSAVGNYYSDVLHFDPEIVGGALAYVNKLIHEPEFYHILRNIFDGPQSYENRPVHKQQIIRTGGIPRDTYRPTINHAKNKPTNSDFDEYINLEDETEDSGLYGRTNPNRFFDLEDIIKDSGLYGRTNPNRFFDLEDIIEDSGLYGRTNPNRFFDLEDIIEDSGLYGRTNPERDWYFFNPSEGMFPAEPYEIKIPKTNQVSIFSGAGEPLFGKDGYQSGFN